jgi:hypothetical protein
VDSIEVLVVLKGWGVCEGRGWSGELKSGELEWRVARVGTKV